jgi:hypothetical protein
VGVGAGTSIAPFPLTANVTLSGCYTTLDKCRNIPCDCCDVDPVDPAEPDECKE